MHIQTGEPMYFLKQKPDNPGAMPENPSAFERAEEDQLLCTFGARGADPRFPPGALEHFQATSGRYLCGGQQE
jgi:hypothetical protein